MIYVNLGSKVSEVVPELYAINGYGATSYKFNVEKVHIYKNVCKNPFSFTLIKMLRLNIALPEKLSKIFV